jgi:hypothetical protein
MRIEEPLMSKKQKKIFESELEGKFICADKFTSEIELLVAKNTDLNYIDAVVQYCDENEIEIETVAKLISKQLKMRIEQDAIQLNYLKKRKTTTKLKF